MIWQLNLRYKIYFVGRDWSEVCVQKAKRLFCETEFIIELDYPKYIWTIHFPFKICVKIKIKPAGVSIFQVI